MTESMANDPEIKELFKKADELSKEYENILFDNKDDLLEKLSKADCMNVVLFAVGISFLLISPMYFWLLIPSIFCFVLSLFFRHKVHSLDNEIKRINRIEEMKWKMDLGVWLDEEHSYGCQRA